MANLLADHPTGMPINKIVPAYKEKFGCDLVVSRYGFSKLIRALEAIQDTLEVRVRVCCAEIQVLLTISPWGEGASNWKLANCASVHVALKSDRSSNSLLAIYGQTQTGLNACSEQHSHSWAPLQVWTMDSWSNLPTYVQQQKLLVEPPLKWQRQWRVSVVPYWIMGEGLMLSQ